MLSDTGEGGVGGWVGGGGGCRRGEVVGAAHMLEVQRDAKRRQHRWSYGSVSGETSVVLVGVCVIGPGWVENNSRRDSCSSVFRRDAC